MACLVLFDLDSVGAVIAETQIDVSLDADVALPRQNPINHFAAHGVAEERLGKCSDL